MFVFFGLLSAMSFGISNVYWKHASKDIDYPYLVLFRGIVAVVFFGLLWIVLISSGINDAAIINLEATATDFFKTAAVCVVCSLGLLFFLKSMKYEAVSIIVAISAVSIFGLLTPILVLGEVFSGIYFLSFPLALLGLILTQKKANTRASKWNKGATYALLASFFWGITYPLFKVLSPRIGALPLSFTLELCVILMAFLWVLTSKGDTDRGQFLRKTSWKHYLILGFLLINGTLFLNLSIQQLTVLNLNIIGNFQYVTSITLAMIIYREKLSFLQVTGIALILFSIVLTQEYS